MNPNRGKRAPFWGGGGRGHPPKRGNSRRRGGGRGGGGGRGRGSFRGGGFRPPQMTYDFTSVPRQVISYDDWSAPMPETDSWGVAAPPTPPPPPTTTSTEEVEIHCEACNRSFKSSLDHRAHLVQHVQCEYGCSFEATSRIMSKHYINKHMGLPALTSGTGGEAQWVAARKAKFPSQETVARKEAEEQARLARGQVLRTHPKQPKLTVAPKQKASHQEEAFKSGQEEGPSAKVRRLMAESAEAPARRFPKKTAQNVPFLQRMLQPEICQERSRLLQCGKHMKGKRFLNEQEAVARRNHDAAEDLLNLIAESLPHSDD